MENIIKDERGSTLVEAAIYFPIILILVIGMVVVAMFKLDKMMALACASEKMTELQRGCDELESADRTLHWMTPAREDYMNYYQEHSILKWVNPSDKQYVYVNKNVASSILHVDYIVESSGGLFGLVDTSATHSGIVLNNPIDKAYAMEDIQTLCQMTSMGTVLQGKTGYTYEDYLYIQFNYVH